MDNTNYNIMPKIDLFPRLAKIGRAITWLFTQHQLASHGDHLFEKQTNQLSFDQVQANRDDLQIMVNGGLLDPKEAENRHQSWLADNA